MIGYVIIPIAIYIGIDLVKLYNRSKFILTSGEIIYHQSRESYNFVLGEFSIRNLEPPEELERKINHLIQSKK